jgi:hypothetical protein
MSMESNPYCGKVQTGLFDAWEEGWQEENEREIKRINSTIEKTHRHKAKAPRAR